MHRVKVKVVEDALDANATIAAANRADFDRAGVTVVNLMSAPGAGKTSVLERVLGDLGDVRVGVLEGDVQGSLDADRLASLHVPVTQLNTDAGFGGECHLDANMVRSALPSVPLDDLDLLIVENVGNLVCPAEFRIGEDIRVMVSSVAEGDDKPLKYPLMFRTCELVLLNKLDLLEHVDFDVDRFLHHLDAVHPGVQHMRDERAHRRGLDAFRDWLVELAAPGPGVTTTVPEAALARRLDAGEAFFGAEAERIARLCHRMAERFARGGRLVALGSSPAARSDVRHVAVEFVHPVIVGKRALPALGLAAEGGALDLQVDLVAEPGDMVIAFGADPAVRPVWAARGARLPDDRLRRGRRVGVRAAHRRPVRRARSWPRRSTTCCGSSCTSSSTIAGCSRAASSGACTTPARRASSTRSSPSRRPTSRRSSPTSARSVLMKADEVGALRAQTLDDGADGRWRRRRARCGRCFDAGGKLLALGNGGSATDAMDAVADLRAAPQGWPARRGDRPHRGPGDPHRARQRHRRRGDVPAPDHRLRARRRRRARRFSTSGGSANVIARARGGAAARAGDDRVRRLRRRPDRRRGARRPRRRRPARSTSRGSRRRRRARTTCLRELVERAA